MAFKRKMRPLDAPELTPDEALAKLEYFCAFRERCPKEVLERIAELRLPKELGEQLFQVLQDDKFFNETRFAENFVRGKFRGNRWGKVRLRMELKMRNIDPQIMERAIDQIEESDYLNCIQTLAERKYQQWADDPLGRQKTAASVIRAGFEPELVFRAVNALTK